MLDTEQSLLWIAVALTVCAVALWRIGTALQAGWNEHIKALQAFYDNSRKE